MTIFSIIIFFHNSVGWNTSIFSQFECILRGNIELWKICMDLKIKYTVYPDTQSNLPIYFTLLPLVLSNCPTYFSMISWVFSRCSTHFSILPWFSFVFQFYFIDFSIGFHQCLDSFHYFTIGFKKLSNLFQHFPICAQLLLNILEHFTIGCHQLFNLFHFFKHWLSLVSSSWFLGTISKGVPNSKMHFWGWIWPATLLGWFCENYFLTVLFFYDWLFPGMVVQDDQTIKRSTHIWWSGVLGANNFSTYFSLLPLVSRNCRTYFSILP